MKNITLTSGLVLAPADLMALAAALQNRYEAIGAPSTQNVRNPLPMRKLILDSLPNRKSKAITEKEIVEIIRSRGYRVNEKSVTTVLYTLRVTGIVYAVGFKKEIRTRGRQNSWKYAFV